MGFSDWQNRIGGFALDPANFFGRNEAKKAAEEQKRAQDAALRQQQINIDQARQNIAGYTGQSQGALSDAYGQARNDLSNSQILASGSLGQGYAQSSSDLAAGYNRARGDMRGVTDLQRYGSGATTAVRSGQISPYDVTGQQSSLEGRIGQGDSLAQRIDRPVSLEDDRGYQFRQQQGEQAINRSAAARGGRASGATLKALAEYNSGLASQEYAAANDRAMQRNAQQMALLGQQYGAAGNVDQMRMAAAMNQAGRSDSAQQQAIQNNLAAQMQAQQNQMALAQMGYGAQGQLAQMANQYGQNQAGLSSQYGQGMAGLQSQYGQNQAGLATGYGQSLAGTYQAAMGTEAGMMGASNQAVGQNAQYAGMVDQAVANNKMQNANAASSIVGGVLGGKSDRRAKINIRDGSSFVRDLLDRIDPYVFQYLDSADGTGEHLGIMAQDLEQSYIGSEMVVETDSGKVVDLRKSVMALLGIVAYLHDEISELKKDKAKSNQGDR